MNRDMDYYDFDFDGEELVQRSGIDEMFYYKDVVNRKFFLNGEVNAANVADICRHIMQINQQDKAIPVERRTPIRLYVSTVGGEVDPGFQLVDTIEASKTPVYTINTGGASSMGIYIMIAGHKRFSMPNARFMMHDGQIQISGNTSNVQDAMKFQERFEARIKNFVLGRTKITGELYDQKYRTEWSMFADEARELGVIDYVIGEDVGLDAVI